MIIVAALEAVALVCVVFFLCRYHREQARDHETVAVNALAQAMSQHAKDSAAWAAERRELVNRIQAPNHIPVGTVPEGWTVPDDEEPDESALVGSIVYDDEYGIEDE